MAAVTALLSLGVLAQLATLPADSIETLRDRARTAESRFERLSRQLAPVTWSGGRYECDEIVGRFCLWFDSTSVRPATLGTEAAAIVDARREAVEAQRRYFAAAPADRGAAGPLVRLLIRDGRAREAASAAGAFAALSGDTLWGELLLGLAHHRAGSGARAERHFVTAMAALGADDRRQWLDPEWLLDPPERRAVRSLDTQSRADYERRFWLLNDPFWITPENERWNEHVARHIETSLLEEVPRVPGMLRWGPDLHQLTVRYGTPVARTRDGFPNGTASFGVVEYWDTAQRAYAPSRLTRGFVTQPPPGEHPALYAARTRSAYALETVARVVELTHQVTRFVRRDSVIIRVDAAMDIAVAPDSTDAAAAVPGTSQPPAAGLFVYDSAFTRRNSAEGVASVAGDTARFTLFVATRPGGVIYGAEMLGDTASIAGRARYALDAHIPGSGPVMSDVLVTRPFGRGQSPERLDDPLLRAIESLIVTTGDIIGLYAEVYRLREGAALDVAVGLESAERPSALGRLARWIGRGLGLVEPAEAPRVGWRGSADDAHYIVALNVPIPSGHSGMYELVLQVTDTRSGEQTEARRRILIR